MLNVITLPVGPLAANCCVVYDKTGGSGFLVDPGDDPGVILDEIRVKELKITHILLTHGHFDHILAVPALKEATGAPVCIHEADAARLESADDCLYARFYGPRGHFTPLRADRTLTDGERLDPGFCTLTTLHTPGHTPGSVCFDDGETLFTGDTLFAASCGRMDFPGGSEDDMRASLQRLAALPGDRRCYAGHDAPFTLEDARRRNPMLRLALRGDAL